MGYKANSVAKWGSGMSADCSTRLLMRATDGRIVRCSTISPCPLAAIFETEKRLWSRVWLTWAAL